MIQIELRGEIVCAQNFEADSIFITYCFLLPEEWRCAEERQLSGVTHCAQVARRRGEQSRRIAHFNQQFELSLSAPKFPKISGWPTVVLEVSSVDSWGRYECRGYGAVSIPALPVGSRHLAVPTWRPLPAPLTGREARLAAMRSFFIGGSPQLREPHLVLAAGTKGENVSSRAGLCSTTSGKVLLRVHLTLQDPTKSGSATLRLHEPPDTLVTSVDQVIGAFLRAQARMAQAREHLRDVLQQ